MNKVISVIIVFLLFVACSGDRSMDKYNRLVKKELASNKHVDSIFFGFHFGMKQKDFFMHCWEMNQKGMLTDGNSIGGEMYVLYKLKNDLKHQASLNFFPEFKDSIIWKMKAEIKYDGWMPWNKSLSADSLLPAVLEMYKKWYSDGNPFMQINDEKKGTVYVKVDGNRRITIKKHDDVYVKADFTDMLVEKNITK